MIIIQEPVLNQPGLNGITFRDFEHSPQPCPCTHSRWVAVARSCTPSATVETTQIGIFSPPALCRSYKMGSPKHYFCCFINTTIY